MAGLPFVVVATRTGKATHLGARSPAVPWHTADMLPAFTVCGSLAVAFTAGHIAEVGCRACLWQAPRYMGWPAFDDEEASRG